MQQLSEMDFSMLQVENNRTPQHISMIFFYDKPEVDGGIVRFKDILRTFECNLPKSTVFRRKLAGDTMGFDTPYWIEDPNFDLEFHVRHIALPKPGDWRQFCIQAARLHSRGVDLGRPPWEAYVIEGLSKVKGMPENSFALMVKVHHAAVDGVALSGMLNGIHSHTADAVPEKLPDDWQGEDDPSPVSLWSRAVVNNARRPVKLVKTLSSMLPKMIGSDKSKSSTGKKGDAARTPLNNKVSAHRVVDALMMDLEQVKAIRKLARQATVNDVMLSIIGGGLRKYLQATDALPEVSLSTAVPISVRDPNDPAPSGNQVGLMKMSLATDIEDPVKRLRSVGRSARHSKEYASANGVRNMLDITEGLFPPVIGAAFSLLGVAAGSKDIPFPHQTIVSNVPGARVPLYLARARLQSAMLLGPLSDGLGLFNGVLSAAGKISITATACREMMPDPEFYRQCLQDAWSELQAAAVGTKKKKRKKRAAKRKRSARRSVQ